MRKPYSQACESNKEPILAVLREVFASPGRILEIGSGTGQHAVHFATHLPHLIWLPTERAENLPGCKLWIEEAGLENLRDPVALDVMRRPWPIARAEGAFSANTAHIMHWDAVTAMFAGVSAALVPGGRFCLYGPFRYNGRDTSESNTRFDTHLRAQDPGMGLRDLVDLERLAHAHGLQLADDRPMPANNRTLIWWRL